MSLPLLALAGCGGERAYTYRQLVMGVDAKVTLYAADEPTAIDAARAAFARLNELEDAMSDYRPDSELMRLCRTHATPVVVSEALFEVLATAAYVSLLSDGAFDVSAGPLTRLWREARAEGRLPSNAEIDAARARVGAVAIVLDPATRTVTLTRPAMALDLGGIGKGFAAQKVVDTLRAHGAPRALVAIAGDIAVGDAPPGSAGWTVATDDGDRHVLQGSCISTSGDRMQFLDVDGVRYSHVLDLRTGLGARIHSEATVIGPNGAIVDALATVLVSRPPDEAARIAARFPGYSVHMRAPPVPDAAH